MNFERILTELRCEKFEWFGPSPIEPFNSGRADAVPDLLQPLRAHVRRARGGREPEEPGPSPARGADRRPDEEERRAVACLVERFDIEPFPDFSAK